MASICAMFPLANGEDRPLWCFKTLGNISSARAKTSALATSQRSNHWTGLRQLRK